MEEYDDFSEAPEYSPKSEFSKARVTEGAVQKVIDARAKEMKEGYFNETVSKDGDKIKTWVPDSRKVFMGSVEALRALLNPEIRRSKKIKEIVKRFEEKKIELFENYSVKNNRWDYSLKKTIDFGEEYIPVIGEVVILSRRERQNSHTSRVVPYEEKGYNDSKVNQYWWKILELYDNLFAILNDLIDELNYFKTRAGW